PTTIHVHRAEPLRSAARSERTEQQSSAGHALECAMADARPPWIALGALNAAIAIAAGAFAAHGLRERRHARALEVSEPGARYRTYHAFGILVAGIAAASGAIRGTQLACWLFQAGIVLFSGSLYALAVTGVKGLGAVTPLGGMAFLAGWLWLAWGAGRRDPLT